MAEALPGICGLEMTRSEGRAPISWNQSLYLQGQRREDNDTSPHRRAQALTRGKSTHKLTR